jgi:hypothetical protein
MAASAVSISAVSFDAKKIANQGGQSSELTVWFHVFQRGFAHVAGIVVSTNGWATRQEIGARFDHFEGNVEVWTAGFSVPGLAGTFAFVCWCEDFADIDNVRKVWNTNGGNQYWITASHF